MQLLNRRGLLLGIGVVLIVLSLYVVLTKKPALNPGGDHYDSFSHQTISDPPGKAPETYGQNATLPVYYGISNFLDEGMTKAQLANMKADINTFCQNEHLSSPIVTINVDSIAQNHQNGDINNPVIVVTFEVKIANKTYDAALYELDSDATVRLVLTAPDKSTVIYDSGTSAPAGNPK